MLKLKSDVVVFRGAGANQFLSCLIGEFTQKAVALRLIIRHAHSVNLRPNDNAAFFQ